MRGFGPRRRYAAGLAGVAGAVTLVAGCGAGTDNPDGSSVGASTVASPSAVLPSAQSAKPGTPPTSTAQGAAPTPVVGPKSTPMEVLGTVSVRQGECLLFTPGDRATSWVLIGAAAQELEPGKGYTVKGSLSDEEAPGCPQGPAFTVISATPTR